MKTVFSIAVLCALSLASFNASAQGWFAGGAIGQASQLKYTMASPITTIDDSDDSGRIFGGYLVSPMQGVVASYIDLGEAHYAGPALGGFSDRLSAEGYDISYIVGWAPGSQERISLFGTLGVFAWDQDVTSTEQGGASTTAFRDEGTSFSIGLGTEIRLGDDGASAWGIHAEWQRLKDVGDASNSGHEYDREVFSVGASYRFGRNFSRD